MSSCRMGRCHHVQDHLQLKPEEPSADKPHQTEIRSGKCDLLPLNMPPRTGPATAEQLQVTLNAWDHLALLGTSTISAVMTQTELTIPPPPMPDNARAAINHFKSWENITTRS
jgi:hypothetical protein